MKRVFIFSVLTVLLYSCETFETTSDKDCTRQACTMEYRSVSVKFVDTEGKPVKVKSYTSINQRTNASMLKGFVPDTVGANGVALVASDANIADISEAGDSIIVTAVYPADAKKSVRTAFFIKGGECACHITKISGPQEVVVK